MDEILKSKKMENISYDIRGKVAQEAGRMAAAGIDVLKLNIGNPRPFGFMAPDDIIQYMTENAVDLEGYSESKGLLTAREAVVNYCKKRNIPNVTVDDVYTGNGVSELIMVSMQVLLNDGDEVLLPAPDYPLWTASVALSGGKPVHYICDEESDWNPDIEDIKRKITPKTKAIVVINPNNPTGTIYSKEILEKIVDIARENSLVIFSDEIYDRLIYDRDAYENFVSIASLAPDLMCITMNGLSKSHLIAGYRCGWMSLSGDKSKSSNFIEGLNLISSMRLCSNVLAQSMIKPALENLDSTRSLYEPGGRVYEQCESIYNGLLQIDGITVKKPKAAFYIFPKLDIKKFGITDDEKFALDLLKQERLLITHGTGFNCPNPDHFRIVFLAEKPQLEDACARLERFLSTYRQN